jgi:hypothetical protein
MVRTYEYQEGKLHVVFGLTEENRIRLLHYSAAPYDPDRPAEPANYYLEGYQFAALNFRG